MSSVESVVDVETLGKWLGLQTAASQACLGKQLTQWTHEERRLALLSKRFQRFQEAFERDPSFLGQCHEMFRDIAEKEQSLQHLLQSSSDLEKESYSEVLFF